MGLYLLVLQFRVPVWSFNLIQFFFSGVMISRLKQIVSQLVLLLNNYLDIKR